MVDEVRVVEARHEHLETIASIEASSFPAPWKRAYFEGELGAGNRFNLVALDSRAGVIAYLFAMHYLDEMHINKIAVAGSFRRHGIASALMTDCIDFAKSHQIRSVSLEVRESNLPAQQFYKTLGFENEYRRRNYYPDGEAAVVMSAEI